MMTAEERAYNYASTQKPTKLQVGEIVKHYNNGYDQAMQDFLEKACGYLKRNYPDVFDTYTENGYNEIEKFKEYLKL